MIEFSIITSGFYRPEQVVMTYDASLRMPTTPQMQAWMDARWQEQLTRARERGTKLFDTPLFRFIETTPEAATLHIVVGDTSYKEYVTTRTQDFAREYPGCEVGNPLAVCSAVETSDGYILLDKRQGVDVYVGRYHVIGGFFERHLDTVVETPDPFGAMRREIREETGIQAEDISEQYCLGVVYDLTMPHGEMCFLTRLHISLEEVLQRTPEEDEIKQLETLQVTAESLREFIVRHHGNISATGEPNLLLYGACKFGEHWFDEVTSNLS